VPPDPPPVEPPEHVVLDDVAVEPDEDVDVVDVAQLPLDVEEPEDDEPEVDGPNNPVDRQLLLDKSSMTQLTSDPSGPTPDKSNQRSEALSTPTFT
jgi:hypothetical protein